MKSLNFDIPRLRLWSASRRMFDMLARIVQLRSSYGPVMGFTKFLAPVILVAGAITVSPASAAVLTATFTGVVSSGHDTTGIFLGDEGNFKGNPYTAVFVYDTGLGTILTNPALVQPPTPPRIRLIGGVISAALTINGHTETLDPASGQIGVSDEGSGLVRFSAFAGQTGPANDLKFLFQDINLTGVSFDISAAFSADGTPLPDDPFAYEVQNSSVSIDTNAHLAATHLTVTSDAVTPVPEPASWAIMLFGFGAIGWTMRGCRRNAVATA